MVSSRFLNGSETCAQKPSMTRLQIPPDYVDVDIFGPAPIQPCIELKLNIVEECFSSALTKVDEITLFEKKGTCKDVIVDEVSEDEEGLNVSETSSDVQKSLGVEDFEVLKVVGQGAFGKVYQVRKRDTSQIYALKVVRKDRVIEKNHVVYMQAERDILAKIDHPFIVRLRYSFQTKYRLYLVLDFINGGHLFFQLRREGLFREELARMYAAEIVSAVSHLHEKGIMHRDLKPQNILLDADGHVMLTDFGLAKEFDATTRSNSLCGTTEYMPPEIIIGKGHDKTADWWSVGILLYEMLTGKLPFTGKNRHLVQQNILKDKLKLPSYLSSEAHSLLKGLLQKEANKRIGSGDRGGDEIKCHKWFKCINWKKLEARQLQPSFLPQITGIDCVANFDEEWTIMPLQESPAATPKNGNKHFKGFTFMGSDCVPLVQCDSSQQ